MMLKKEQTLLLPLSELVSKVSGLFRYDKTTHMGDIYKVVSLSIYFTGDMLGIYWNKHPFFAEIRLNHDSNLEFTLVIYF